jgi:glycosyltransferase involved in cell wall biosynthesis
MPEKPAILFVTPVLGHPPKGGPELRIENSIKALAKVSTVSLYCRMSRSRMGGDTAVRYLETLVNRLDFAPFCRRKPGLSSLVPRGINRISRTVLGRNLAVVSDEVEAEYQDVVRTAELLGVDVIWLGYGNISYPLLKYIKEHSGFPVVLDTDSVWSRFVLRGLPYGKNEKEKKRIEKEGFQKEEEERWGTKLADVTTGVSMTDMEYYRGLTNDPAKVHLFSNGIDLDDYARVAPPDGFRKPCMYLAGTFWQGSPMEDAARWMLDLVLPRLTRELPGIHFYIAGRGSKEVLADVHDDDVTISGELPSVLPYLTNASVAVVPLRFESGTRFKILEAGACNIPVVSTTLGAEGIPVVDGKDILIADTPEDFTRSVARIIRDRELAISLTRNLKELVANHYSIDVLAREGDEIINYLISRKE